MIKQYKYPSPSFNFKKIWRECCTIIIHVKPGHVFKCADPEMHRGYYVTCIRGNIESSTLTMLAYYFNYIVFTKSNTQLRNYHSRYVLYMDPHPNTIINSKTILSINEDMYMSNIQCEYIYSSNCNILLQASKNPKIKYITDNNESCVSNKICAYHNMNNFITGILPALYAMKRIHKAPKFVSIKIILLTLPAYITFRNNKLCWIWDD